MYDTSALQIVRAICEVWSLGTVIVTLLFELSQLYRYVRAWFIFFDKKVRKYKKEVKYFIYLKTNRMFHYSLFTWGLIGFIGVVLLNFINGYVITLWPPESLSCNLFSYMSSCGVRYGPCVVRLTVLHVLR